MKVAFTIPDEHLEDAAVALLEAVNTGDPAINASEKANIVEALAVTRKAKMVELPEDFFSQIDLDPQPLYKAIAYSVIKDFSND